MNKPSLFLCMPQTYAIYQPIVEHLKLHGFDVIDLSFAHNNDIFRRPTLSERLEISLRKKLLKNTAAKDKVIERNNLQRIAQARQAILDKVQVSSHVDFALFIRGNL